MRWLVCVCIGWHETAPITLILRHLGNQLSFALTSSRQAKYGPIKTAIYSSSQHDAAP
jgi:hypothetical protein